MLKTTLAQLCCPRCKNPDLQLEIEQERKLPEGPLTDVVSGALTCRACRTYYPILQGVAFLLKDVTTYLQNHCKGISQKVGLQEIPEEYQEDYGQALSEYQEQVRLYPQDFDEDLESARVNALYLMNHYLRAQDWNTPQAFAHDLVAAHWDQGPIDVVAGWLGGAKQIVELGSGVGGLAGRVVPIGSSDVSYLGVDSSFLSTWYARQWNILQPPGAVAELRIPDDLLAGAQSRLLRFTPRRAALGRCDFVLADMEGLPLRESSRERFYDAVVALNAIDMLEEPADLALQAARLLRPGGMLVQSAPYIWAERVAKKLRKTMGTEVVSAQAARQLLESQGFSVVKEQEGIPWIFYKHARQIELYWVHALAAVMPSS